MNYRLMRLKKYYDAIRTNKPFMQASLKQKYKILSNILKFFSSSPKKPLIVPNKPVTAQIEPTSKCNLRCKMCIRNNAGVQFGTMTFNDFKKILEKLDCLYKVGLSGQGELFLNSEIFDMIKYANKRGILVHVNSNGTLLTKEIINKLCETEVGEIGISVDSTKKKEYEKIRVGANYDRLIENIKNLTSEIKKRDKNMIVTITPIIFKKNIDELPEFIKLAKSVGVKKVAFQTLQIKENYLKNYGSDMKSQVINKDVERLKQKMKEANKLAEKFGITIIFDEEESPGCIWPWRGIYITWNGDVTACCKIIETQEFGLGNVLKQDLEKVWNGKKYQELRSYLGKREPPECCKGCNRV